jgi:hypothetical protein
MLHVITETVHLVPTTLARACFHEASSEAYGKLIRDLAEGKAHADQTGNVREAGIGQLYAVLAFLQSNKDAESAGLFKPLAALAEAAWDAAQGARPALFADAKRRTGAPDNKIRTCISGIMAGLVALLMTAGQRPPKAIEIVAKEADRLGIKTARGHRLEPRHVAEWYDETDGRGTNLRARFYRAIVERFGETLRQEIDGGTDPAIAVRHVLDIIPAISD